MGKEILQFYGSFSALKNEEAGEREVGCLAT